MRPAIWTPVSQQGYNQQGYNSMRRVVATLIFILAISLSALANISDALRHQPPMTGSLAYNTFVPPNTPGASYVDPVFGSTVHRLTTDHVESSIYARNMWWNADGTLFWHSDSSSIVNTTTGATVYSSMPRGPNWGDSGFDPVLPNVYFYWTGATIHKVTLGLSGTYTDAVYLTAPSTLLTQGSSVNWLDASGRYMVVRYGPEPSVRVYDRNNLAAGPYAGAVSGANVDAGGWTGISPDGQYITGGLTAWAINHQTRAVNTTGTNYWDLCSSGAGSHGSYTSASDGRNYHITTDCHTGPLVELWRVDITNNVAGQPPETQKNALNNRLLLTLPAPSTQSTHSTSVAKGTLRDWAFYSIENEADVFDSSVLSWTPYQSEIIAINVLTLEVRRLAHHRSRSAKTDYASEPRVSTSWTGNIVGWASNFNQRGVVDVFATPFQSGPSPPLNLRLTK
jgi:hypothetical protein